MDEIDSTDSTDQRVEPPEWCEKFLELVAKGTIAEACRQLQLDRTTPYKVKDRCPDFAAKWDEIKHATVRRIHDNLVDRLADGWEETIVVGGQESTKRVYDNKTALAYMKSREPEKYSERRFQPEQATGEQHKVVIEFKGQPDVAPDTTKTEED